VVFANPIAQGNTASIYLHEGKIIKLFKDLLPDSEAEYEANKQIFAFTQGLPVPRIYEVSRINGQQAIIMEYVVGRIIGNVIFEDMIKAEQYMTLSVDVQLKIHDVKADKFGSMTDKLYRQLLSASILSEKQQNALIEKLHKMQFEKRLCHGDYHVFNLILNKNEIDVTIIDWADSSAGDSKADAYRTYLLYSQYSMELANLYIRLYCDKSGMLQDEIFAWEPIVAGARLSENIASEEANRLLEIVARCCPA